MSLNENEVYRRITALISTLNNYETTTTVSSIAKNMNCTASQVRIDLQRINSNGIAIDPQNTVTQFDIWESRYDEDPLELSFDIPTEDQYASHILFFDNPKETELFKQHSLSNLKIKDSVLSDSAQTLEHKKRIEAAFKNGHLVKFNYKDSRGELIESVVSEPILFHNTTDNLWYCIQFAPEGHVNAFRLDRICSAIQEIKQSKFDKKKNEKRFKYLDYVWGSDFNYNDKPIHVKVLINVNTANILKKIKADTSDRKYGVLKKRKKSDIVSPLPAVWPEDGEYYIYEDELIGLSSFRSWLMTFGSSVKALEPKELAKELYLSSVRRLRNYEEGNTFHTD